MSLCMAKISVDAACGSCTCPQSLSAICGRANTVDAFHRLVTGCIKNYFDLKNALHFHKTDQKPFLRGMENGFNILNYSSYS